MTTRSFNNKDMLGGALLLVLGSGVAIYSLVNYSLGSLWRMGPGMFPMLLGVLIALLGLLVLVPSFWRAEALPAPEWRPAIAVVAATLAFAGLIETTGLVPAIVALTVIAGLADNKFSIRRTLAISAGMSLFAFLVFRVALGLNIAAFRWGF